MTNPENRKNNLLHIFNKKITYKKNPYPDADNVKESLKNRLAQYQNEKHKIPKSKSIYDYKEALMEEAVHQTPEGWGAYDDPLSP